MVWYFALNQGAYEVYIFGPQCLPVFIFRLIEFSECVLDHHSGCLFMSPLGQGHAVYTLSCTLTVQYSFNYTAIEQVGVDAMPSVVH